MADTWLGNKVPGGQEGRSRQSQRAVGADAGDGPDRGTGGVQGQVVTAVRKESGERGQSGLPGPC